MGNKPVVVTFIKDKPHFLKIDLMTENNITDNQTKPTVLFIMHMPPPIHGASAVGQYIKDSALVNEAFDCHYINITTAKNLEDIGKGDFSKYGLFCRKVMQVLHTISTLKPAIIYMTPCTTGGPFFKDNLMLNLAKIVALMRSKKSKFVVHLHNKGVQTMQTDWKYSMMYKYCFANLKVILLGESLYHDVASFVKRENVIICPNGIPDTNAHPEQLPDNKVPRILWLSHIMKTKGVIEFLDALKILKAKKLPFVVDLIGGMTGEITQAEFADEIELRGLSDIVEYHGNKYGQKKDEYLHNSDIFVLPSYTEAFPLTILEAMQYSLPVVASNVGGISSQVEDGVNGFLLGGKEPIMKNTFRPDPTELASKLELLLRDPEMRKAMGKEGRRRFEGHFTLPVFEQRFTDALLSLLKKDNSNSKQ